MGRKTKNIKPRKQTEELYKKGLAQMSQKQKKYLENLSPNEGSNRKEITSRIEGDCFGIE